MEKVKITYGFCDGTPKEIELENIDSKTKEIFDTLVREELNHERKMRWRKEKSLDDLKDRLGWEPIDPNADVEKIILENEEKAELEKAKCKLSEKQRHLLQLHYYEGKTECEIASDFGVSQPAINQQLSTIHKKLRKNLLNYYL